MYKRYEIYRDYTKKYVTQAVKDEQGLEAYNDVRFRTTNISICKSIINKKAVLYVNGVRREVIGNEIAQWQIDQVCDLLNINTVMRKANRWEELFKNAIVNVYAYPNESTGKWRIKLNVLPPYQLDVIENAHNPEEGLVYIYSYYTSNDTTSNYAPVGESGIHGASATGSFRAGDNVDQRIANAPIDYGCEKREYVWWSPNYHFTTNEKAEIISNNFEDGYVNPTGEVPYINVSNDQDGNFWALGGEDIIDGSVLVNLFLTELYYIAKYQGMGVFYMFGKNVPEKMKVGPSQAMVMKVQEGEPTPQIGFASSNPPLDAYMASIKEYISILLKTNKIEPASVIGSENAVNATSGIQELIQKSELLEDQEDKKETYRDIEPEIFETYIKWHNLLFDNGILDDDFAYIGRIPEDTKVTIKFNPPQSVQTESEKLDILKKRQDMGIDSMLDTLMRDNPELSKEDAENKLIEIAKNKALDLRAKVMSSYTEDNMQDMHSNEETENGGQGNIPDRSIETNGQESNKESER